MTIRRVLLEATDKLVGQKLLNGDEDGQTFMDVAGHPCVVFWSDVGWEELEIIVWWNFDHLSHQSYPGGHIISPQIPRCRREHYKNFIGGVFMGWLERKTGLFLQGRDAQNGILKRYMRREEKDIIAQLDDYKPLHIGATGMFCFHD